MSVRESESLNAAVLRALQAPLPPDLRPGHPSERPECPKERYLRSNITNVRNENLWDFLYGVTVEGSSNSYHDEAAESEEETSEGSFSRVTGPPAG